MGASYEPRSGRATRAGGALAFAGWWAVLLGLWLALANRLSAQELVAGAAAASIGAGAAVLVRAERPVLPRPRAAWLLELWRPLLAIPGDLWTLGRGLVAALAGRTPGGEVQLVAFAAAEGPEGAARRVLATIAHSIPPNSVVIGFDDEHGAIIVHRLAPADSERS